MSQSGDSTGQPQRLDNSLVARSDSVTRQIREEERQNMAAALPPTDTELAQQYAALLNSPVTWATILGEPEDFIYAIREPIVRFRRDTKMEVKRINWFRLTDRRCSSETRRWIGKASRRQRYALARHLVCRRWEKLGVWNDTWRLDTSAGEEAWTWPWQRSRDAVAARRLIGRAIDACGRVDRGAYARSVMARAAAAASDLQRPNRRWTEKEGDAFIASRPWFVFEAELLVEKARRARLPAPAQARLEASSSAGGSIRSRWIRQGLWNGEWDLMGGDLSEVGWTWRGERGLQRQLGGGGHELEDLAQLNRPRDIGLRLSAAQEQLIQEWAAHVFAATTGEHGGGGGGLLLDGDEDVPIWVDSDAERSPPRSPRRRGVRTATAEANLQAGEEEEGENKENVAPAPRPRRGSRRPAAAAAQEQEEEAAPEAVQAGRGRGQPRRARTREMTQTPAPRAQQQSTSTAPPPRQVLRSLPTRREQPSRAAKRRADSEPAEPLATKELSTKKRRRRG